MLIKECHYSYQGLFQLFAQRGGGGKMRLYGLLERQACIHAQSMWQTRRVWGDVPREILILDHLLDTIWWNLKLFLHKHNLPFIVSLKLL